MAQVYWNEVNGQLTEYNPSDIVGVGAATAYDALSVVSQNGGIESISTATSSVPYIKLASLSGNTVTQTAKIWTDGADSNIIKIDDATTTRLTISSTDIQFNGQSLLTVGATWSDTSHVLSPIDSTANVQIGTSYFLSHKEEIICKDGGNPNLYFIIQPANQTINVGLVATFTVSVGNTQPGGMYQWYKNGTLVYTSSGLSANSNYTTPIQEMSNNGDVYFVIYTDIVGSVTSNNATITVTASSPYLLSVGGTANVSGVVTTHSLTQPTYGQLVDTLGNVTLPSLIFSGNEISMVSATSGEVITIGWMSHLPNNIGGAVTGINLGIMIGSAGSVSTNSVVFGSSDDYQEINIQGINNTMIGMNNTSFGAHAVMLGFASAIDTSTSVISIGDNQQGISTSDNSIMVGTFYSMTTSPNCVFIGTNPGATYIYNASNSVFIGNNVAGGNHAIVIGQNSFTTDTTTSSISIGKGCGVEANYSMACGNTVTVTENYAIKFGSYCSLSLSSLQIGQGADIFASTTEINLASNGVGQLNIASGIADFGTNTLKCPTLELVSGEGSAPEAGNLCFDGVHFKGYNGSEWVQIGS